MKCDWVSVFALCLCVHSLVGVLVSLLEDDSSGVLLIYDLFIRIRAESATDFNYIVRVTLAWVARKEAMSLWMCVF